LSPEEKIADRAAFAKKHLVGIADNTNRRVQDEDSWYIGLLRGQQMAFEWALRELRGEDHAKAIEAQIAEGLDSRLRA
jgi:hypothetical protein